MNWLSQILKNAASEQEVPYNLIRNIRKMVINDNNSNFRQPTTASNIFFIDGLTPCKIIPSDHISPSYRIVELEDGKRVEVPAWRIKSHRKQQQNTPADNLCPNCGQLSRYKNICEHCESDM